MPDLFGNLHPWISRKRIGKVFKKKNGAKASPSLAGLTPYWDFSLRSWSHLRTPGLADPSEMAAGGPPWTAEPPSEPSGRGRMPPSTVSSLQARCHVAATRRSGGMVERNCDTPTHGLIGLIEYSYQQVATSFSKAGLQKTPRLSVLGPEKLGDG